MTHALPSTPQVAGLRPLHCPLLQHPHGHDWAVHVHEPDTHAWPWAHGGPLPHWQAPSRLQESAPRGEQCRQAAPPVPHVVVDGAKHSSAEQQPLGQVMALHRVQTPLVHIWSCAHDLQVKPAAPHNARVVPSSQWLSRQHPEHEDGLHSHLPPTHTCPSSQGGPEPQTHTPSSLQSSDLTSGHCLQASPPTPHATGVESEHTFPSQHPGQRSVSQVHFPLTQALYKPHGGPSPQRHRPSVVHTLLLTGSHATHRAPRTPQLATLRSMHWLPLQHPLQSAAWHTHSPRMHSCPAEHAGASPHRHSADKEQLSARSSLQDSHTMPGSAHVLKPRSLQRPSTQHPPGQETWLHTQTPSSHACPVAQEAVQGLPASPEAVSVVCTVLTPKTHCLSLHPNPGGQLLGSSSLQGPGAGGAGQAPMREANTVATSTRGYVCIRSPAIGSVSTPG